MKIILLKEIRLKPVEGTCEIFGEQYQRLKFQQTYPSCSTASWVPSTRARIFAKGGFSSRGKIIAKGRKTAIVGYSELDQRYELRRFQHAVSHLLGSFDFWIDWVDNPDKQTSRRVQILAHNL